MAHISEFRKGDLVSFNMKGTKIVARIMKINRKSVKAVQTVAASWSVQAAFGRPARTKTRAVGTPWTLGVRDDGVTVFEHEDEARAAKSKVACAKDALVAAVDSARAGMSDEEIFEFVTSLLS